jgi:deoxyribonuclease-4
MSYRCHQSAGSGWPVNGCSGTYFRTRKGIPGLLGVGHPRFEAALTLRNDPFTLRNIMILSDQHRNGSGPDDGSVPHDEFGAHVSAAGGVGKAPGRAREIESVCLQLFTKQPNRWAEPTFDDAVEASFKEEVERHGIRVAGSHDSYLINLASPDKGLWERSLRSFQEELSRCAVLGLDFLVTHPGNATDGDLASGIVRNAEGITRALEEVSGPTRILLEITAGAGTTVGASFQNLESILRGVPSEHQGRLGICFDTCHAYSAGYDLAGDYDGVWAAFHSELGLDRLQLFHMNDSKNPFASRKDRHQHLGEGSLGIEPFRRIVLDERFTRIPKILETPKEPDPVGNDLKNLGFLRGLRSDPRNPLPRKS